MRRYLTLLLLSVVLGLGARAYAHHSFEATYVEEESVTIQGELVRFIFRNPHSFVHLTVRAKNGSQVRYAVEWTAARQLVMDGVTEETLKVGDFVVITGRPGRNPSDHRMRLTSLLRPSDGFGWRHRGGSMMD